MIELYLEKINENDPLKTRHCVIMTSMEAGEEVISQIGSLFIESVKKELLTDPKSAGLMMFMLVGTLREGSRSVTQPRGDRAGSMVCSGNVNVIKRKNFLIGVDEDGIYIKKSDQDKKFRKLELDDIADIDVDGNKPDEEIPF